MKNRKRDARTTTRISRPLQPLDRLPTIAEALRFRGEQMGYTVSRMAAELGMQRSHYSEVLSGKRRLPIGAMKKAYAMGLPPEVLLQQEPDPKIMAANRKREQATCRGEETTSLRRQDKR